MEYFVVVDPWSNWLSKHGIVSLDSQCISVSIHMCRCLPSPPVPTLLSTDAAELITGVQQLMKSSVLTDDQVNIHSDGGHTEYFT